MLKLKLVYLKISLEDHKARKTNEKNKIGKTYYIVRRDAKNNAGLFSYVITSLAHIYYARLFKWIPVIDMQNYSNIYLDEEKKGIVNSWEYFFEQPCRVSLSDIPENANIIFSSFVVPRVKPHDGMEFFSNELGRLYFWQSFVSKYLRINKEVEMSINEEWNKITNESSKGILGVLLRGTDYKSLKPKDHPKQPEINDVIDKIDDIWDKWGCNKIFLATEDIDIANKMIEKYGDKVIMNKKQFVNYIPGSLYGENKLERNDDARIKGVEYLTTIVMLSRCENLIACRCSGTVGAYLFRKKRYKNSYIFDEGMY